MTRPAVIVTAPIWAPVSAVAGLTDAMTGGNSVPTVVNPEARDPSDRIVGKIDVLIENREDQSGIYLEKLITVGPDRFLLLSLGKGKAPDLRPRWFGTFITASGERSPFPIELSEDKVPLGRFGANGLLLYEQSAQTLSVLSLADFTTHPLAVKTSDCVRGVPEVSPSRRFVLCRMPSHDLRVFDSRSGTSTDMPLTRIDGAARQPIAHQYFNSAVDDAGTVFLLVDGKRVYRSSEGGFQDLLTIEASDITPMGAAGEPADHLLIAAIKPDQNNWMRILALSPRDGRAVPLGDAEWGRPLTAPSRLAIGGRRFALIRAGKILVWTRQKAGAPSSGASEPALAAGPMMIKVGRRHDIRGAAFDSTGRSLVVVGDGATVRIFQFADP